MIIVSRRCIVFIERRPRVLDSGVTEPEGRSGESNYDNYRNSWGAIRPAKRQKRTSARFSCAERECNRRVLGFLLHRFFRIAPILFLFFFLAVKINVIFLITVYERFTIQKIACSAILMLADISARVCVFSLFFCPKTISTVSQ